MADVFQFEDDNHTDGNFDNDDNDEIILDDVSHFTSFPFHFFLFYFFFTYSSPYYTVKLIDKIYTYYTCKKKKFMKFK